MKGQVRPPVPLAESLDKEVAQLIAQYPRLVQKGHFDFGNGFHGSKYLNPDELLLHPQLIVRFAQNLIERAPYFVTHNTEVIAGPVGLPCSGGGAILAHTMGVLLESNGSIQRPRLFVPLDRKHPRDGFIIREDFKRQLAGKKVWLVDDICNTGQTLHLAMDALLDVGADVIATGCVFKRLNNSLTIPNMPTQVVVYAVRIGRSQAAVNCDLCKEKKVPLETVPPPRS